VEGLRELIERAEGNVNSENCVTEDRPAEERVAWWFLSGNTKFANGGVVIFLGNGRSTHTWRDLKATLYTLGTFCKRPKTLRFQVSDEFDGFETIGRCKAVISKEGVKLT